MSEMYKSFVKVIHDKFENHLREIQANYNFDNGDEFEIAICKTLRFVLPKQYGVCRGFIVDSKNEIVGDDIIIFDHQRFSTLRFLDDNEYAQKQNIPFEAVYAYIEVKNTLIIEGDDGNSISKAIKQCRDVKEKLRRDPVPFCKYSVNGEPFLKPLKHWPVIGNPIYTVIISRGVREKRGGDILDSLEVNDKLLNKINTMGSTMMPDLIISDKNTIIVPIIESQAESPFFMDEKSKFGISKSTELAYGLGVTYMLYAFDNIRLGRLYWPAILAEGMGVELKNEKIN